MADIPTMGTFFRQGGYRTGAVGKLHVHGEERLGRDLGFDYRGLRYYTYKYDDYVAAVGKENVDRHAPHREVSIYNKEGYAGRYNPYNKPTLLDADEDLMYDNLVTQQAIGFLRERRSKPFMLWCGLEKPHPEWSAPKRFHDLYDPEDMVVPETYWETRDDLPDIMKRRARPHREPFGAFSRPGLSRDEEEGLVRGAIAAYYATVSFMDWNMGRILDCLEEEGLLDDTLVIYTPDHGDNLFEHGLVQKLCFFEGAAHVPLIFSHPAGLPSHVAKRKIVGLIDVLPTMLELGGLEAPESLDSLAAAMRSDADPFDGFAISDFYKFGVPERMIRVPDWKYIYSHGSGEQLYGMKRDPKETRNLAGEAEHAGVQAELKQRIREAWGGEVPTFSTS